MLEITLIETLRDIPPKPFFIWDGQGNPVEKLLLHHDSKPGVWAKGDEWFPNADQYRKWVNGMTAPELAELAVEARACETIITPLEFAELAADLLPSVVRGEALPEAHEVQAMTMVARLYMMELSGRDSAPKLPPPLFAERKNAIPVLQHVKLAARILSALSRATALTESDERDALASARRLCGLGGKAYNTVRGEIIKKWYPPPQPLPDEMGRKFAFPVWEPKGLSKKERRKPKYEIQKELVELQSAGHGLSGEKYLHLQQQFIALANGAGNVGVPEAMKLIVPAGKKTEPEVMADYFRIYVRTQIKKHKSWWGLEANHDLQSLLFSDVINLRLFTGYALPFAACYEADSSLYNRMLQSEKHGAKGGRITQKKNAAKKAGLTGSSGKPKKKKE